MGVIPVIRRAVSGVVLRVVFLAVRVALVGLRGDLAE
jgi:hypothetical protein